MVLPDGTYIEPESISYTFSRSGGPGGQHVNRTETAVLLRFNPELSGLSQRIIGNIHRQEAGRFNSEGILLIRAENYRSQRRNLDDALSRLADIIAEARKRRKKRVETKPTAASRERRLKSKKEHSEKKSLRKKPLI